MTDKSLGLYIHIPFCKARCYYCDFNSYAGKEELVPAYFNALKKEIGLYGQQYRDYSIKTVFIGGGTPSVVNPRYVYELLNTCREAFNIERNAEVSIETNPGTLSYEKLTAYKAIGINRLSIGLQAWQNRLLKEMGRIHCAEEFADNFKQARKAGFRNINVDLIFGLPGQTTGDWNETLQNVIALEPAHISAYSLKIEDETVFGKKYEAGELVPAEDETDREMYWLAIDKLERAGFKHYEISNFSRPGYECKHNLIYWKAREYIGVGAGAHSYLKGKRFNNVLDIERYISLIEQEKEYTENGQAIDKSEEMSEFVLLGLRLIDGISTGEFRERFGEDLFTIFGKRIQKLLGKELLQKKGDRLSLTPHGLDLANAVFMEFV